MVLSKRNEDGRIVGLQSGYIRYAESNDQGVFGSSTQDNRLGPKDLVVGLSEEGKTTAQAYALNPNTLHNTKLGEQDVLVLGLDAQTGVAFERRLNNQTLTFERNGSELQDTETKSTWRVNGLNLSLIHI